MSLKDGFAGRVRLIPAVPATVAVLVSVPATAAVAALNATTALPMMMMIRCLMIYVFSLEELVVLD